MVRFQFKNTGVQPSGHIVNEIDCFNWESFIYYMSIKRQFSLFVAQVMKTSLSFDIFIYFTQSYSSP